MNMKSFISKLTLLIMVFISCAVSAQSTYEKRVEGYTSRWNALIPRYTKVQFAGSMGMFSAGVGWNYGKNHWESDLLLGFVPRNADRHAMATLTLKQNYLPWSIPLHENILFEPLSCGLYVNTLLDRDFWMTNPERYPKGYYSFSTRVRIHVFMGERITFKLNPKKFHNKSITLFYELSSCDLYLITAVTNRYLKPSDYLSLSFGVKVQIL